MERYEYTVKEIREAIPKASKITIMAYLTNDSVETHLEITKEQALFLYQKLDEAKVIDTCHFFITNANEILIG